jgi:hypothetical protein
MTKTSNKTKTNDSRAKKGGKTLVTLLLDRSGSMQKIKDDTIGGVNAYVESLQDGAKTSDGDTRFSLVLFDTEYRVGMKLETVHQAIKVQDVPALTSATYTPRGGTPLIDAAVTTIHAVAASVAERPDVKIVIAIQTDGDERDSRENTWDGLKSLIAEKEAAGWQFIFMGAGIDAYAQGARMGLKADKILSYGTDKAATASAFRSTGLNTALYASGASDDTSYSSSQKLAAGDLYDDRT